jgi:hypothetical protein
MDRALHYKQQIRYYQEKLEEGNYADALYHKQQLRYHQERLEEVQEQRPLLNFYEPCQKIDRIPSWNEANDPHTLMREVAEILRKVADRVLATPTQADTAASAAKECPKEQTSGELDLITPDNNQQSMLDSYLKPDETITSRMGHHNAAEALAHDEAYMKAFNRKKERLVATGLTPAQAEKQINDKINRELFPHMTKPVKNPLLLFQDESDSESGSEAVEVEADD